MNVDSRLWECAKMAGSISGVPAEWIYSQWSHETGGFTSDLYVEYNNLGGLTQEEKNDIPQPDGDYYYMKFGSPEEYANYFGRYIKKYFPTAAAARSMPEYVTALKFGEPYVYFGDDVDVYLEGMEGAYKYAFES